MNLTEPTDKRFGKQEISDPLLRISKPLTSDTLKMQALVWKGKNDVRIKEVPRPLISDSRDIILKVTATAICGTDCHVYSGIVPEMKTDDILGHEFMGIVNEVGSEVQNLRVGDRVVVSAVIVCGQCEFCKREEYSGCHNTNPNLNQREQFGQTTAAVFGFSHLAGGVPGGQAEYVRVPFADTNCLKLPESVPDNVGLFLSDIIPTSYFGVSNARVKEGDVVAVWGLGPVGLLACRWCQIKGAAAVIGIDRVPERLELAKKSLGIDVINFDEADVVTTLNKLYPHGIDAGIECAGSEYAKSFRNKAEQALGIAEDTSEIITEIIQCVRPFGHVSIVGVYLGFANRFPIGAFMQKGQTMRGGQVPCHKFWKKCLNYIESGEFDPRFILTTYGKLSEAPELYKDFYAKKNGIVKIFLRPDSMPQSDPNFAAY